MSATGLPFASRFTGTTREYSPLALVVAVPDTAAPLASRATTSAPGMAASLSPFVTLPLMVIGAKQAGLEPLTSSHTFSSVQPFVVPTSQPAPASSDFESSLLHP